MQSLDMAAAGDSLASAFESTSGTVASVRVEADSEELAARARPMVQLRAGVSVSDDAIRADVQRLWTLGGLEDVQVQSSGPEQAVVLRYVIRSAPAIRTTFQRGDSGADDTVEKELGLMPGAPYEPSALASGLSRARESLFDQGYREATVTVTGRRLEDHRVDVCVHVHRGRKLLLHSVSITGNGQPLRDLELERDVLEMQALYYDRGFLTATVAPPEVSVVDDALRVRIAVQEGPMFKVGSIRVSGALVTTKAAYSRRLTVKPGDVFSRSKLAADVEQLRALHREQNQPEMVIEPETTLDPKKSRADIVLRVIAPDPQGL